jgi:hypothetical protein
VTAGLTLLVPVVLPKKAAHRTVLPDLVPSAVEVARGTRTPSSPAAAVPADLADLAISVVVAAALPMTNWSRRTTPLAAVAVDRLTSIRPASSQDPSKKLRRRSTTEPV